MRLGQACADLTDQSPQRCAALADQCRQPLTLARPGTRQFRHGVAKQFADGLEQRLGICVWFAQYARKAQQFDQIHLRMLGQQL